MRALIELISLAWVKRSVVWGSRLPEFQPAGLHPACEWFFLGGRLLQTLRQLSGHSVYDWRIVRALLVSLSAD